METEEYARRGMEPGEASPADFLEGYSRAESFEHLAAYRDSLRRDRGGLPRPRAPRREGRPARRAQVRVSRCG